MVLHSATVWILCWDRFAHISGLSIGMMQSRHANGLTALQGLPSWVSGLWERRALLRRNPHPVIVVQEEYKRTLT